jgi:nucleoside-diphosphate-sugar epimerase
MTTVFVTGATGFVGRAVIPELLKHLEPEDRLIMLVRRPVEYTDKRVVTVSGDLESLEEIDSMVRKADFIIHIAGEARLGGGNCNYGINVTSTKKLLDMARAGGSLQRFVFISSVAAMDRSPSDPCNEPLTIANTCFPRTEYGKSKRMAEEAVLQSGLPYTIFRPGFVYGPGMRENSHLRKFAHFMRKGLPLHRLDFPGKISLIHVDDLAIAIARCLKGDSGKNRTYLAETECMSLGDALSLLGESLFGRKSLQIHVPVFKTVLQRLHSMLPVIVAGLFLDYFRMDDPAFRAEFIDPGQKRSLGNYVHDITRDLPGC